MEIISKNELLQELDLTESNIEDFKSDDTVQIFTDGPPPLVPLAPVKTINYAESIVKDLPKDTPPLVPIKPLVDINALESIIEQNDSIKYQCNMCNSEFTSVVDLKEHKLNTCQPNALQCNICRKEFKDSKKLIGHLKGHIIAKDYGCKICGKRYPNPSTFTVHMRTHTDDDKNYACNVCDMKFYHPCRLLRHKKTHEKPHIACHICHRTFTSSSILTKHIENKHGMTYVEETVLQPDEGVSQIFVQYRTQENEKPESTLEYEQMDPLTLQKSESDFFNSSVDFRPCLKCRTEVFNTDK
ncbi:hypothetical protein NQ318_008966 [Aromia moschata]|uniref:C2H2-type domain-containing protein n=1 Tax=Aromia moschata TaxID=1265417 RepID=A0AAV8ZAQ1_9CUCU|nr:hypothetical protein NQ318_008966 [Aromia moschata]